MKFLGTLAFGFSSIAALIATMLSFGFHLKVEGPMSPQQVTRDQQLNQCTTLLSAAEQQVNEYQSRVVSLEQRLREATLIVDQTATRLSAEVAARVQAMAEAKAVSANTGSSSVPMIAGLGLGVLMLPAGFLLGRRNRAQELPLLTVQPAPALMAEPVREQIASALPVYDPAREPPARNRGSSRMVR